MTVKDLKAILEQADDNALIVIEGDDHSYRKADADITTALKENGQLFEDYGDEYAEPGAKRVSVVVIR